MPPTWGMRQAKNQIFKKPENNAAKKSSLFALRRKWEEMIPVLAEAARNIKNVVERRNFLFGS
jgi:hypothetical protein